MKITYYQEKKIPFAFAKKEKTHTDGNQAPL
jgi:hypothetical protein